MKPQRIILLRHAESMGNADKLVYSHTPTHAFGITEKGKEQAKLAAKKLQDCGAYGPIKTYCSPYKRTRETLQTILDTGLVTIRPIYEDPRLREQDHGHLRDDETRQKTKKECFEFSQFYYRFPDGESGADVYNRISTFLESLHRSFETNEYDNILIVTHGLTARLFIMRWFHKTVEEYESWDNLANCDMYVMNLNTFTGHYDFPDNIKIWEPDK